MTEELSDIEHAKKYAEESTSLAISMFNPKAEEIAKWACLYGLTYKNDKIKELQKQISILLSCKNCPDNKGGYICEKEYNDKCLAQKIQYIKELQEEIANKDKDIAELKAQATSLALGMRWGC